MGFKLKKLKKLAKPKNFNRALNPIKAAKLTHKYANPVAANKAINPVALGKTINRKANPRILLQKSVDHAREVNKKANPLTLARTTHRLANPVALAKVTHAKANPVALARLTHKEARPTKLLGVGSESRHKAVVTNSSDSPTETKLVGASDATGFVSTMYNPPLKPQNQAGAERTNRGMPGDSKMAVLYSTGKLAGDGAFPAGTPIDDNDAIVDTSTGDVQPVQSRDWLTRLFDTIFGQRG